MLVIALVILAVLILSGILAVSSMSFSGNADASYIPKGYVSIPGAKGGELVPKDCAHAIPNGATVLPNAALNGTADIVVEPNGSETVYPYSGNCSVTQGPDSESAGNWIEGGTWCYCPASGLSIGYYQADWTVPTAPYDYGGQTLYLFIGLQHQYVTDYPLIQPVLQWGTSAAGGGNYWTIDSWAVTQVCYWLFGCFISAFYGNLISVNVGENIQGTLSGYNCSSSNNQCNWDIITQDTTQNAITNIQCGGSGRGSNNIPCGLAEYLATNVLEGYGPNEGPLSGCVDFPNSSGESFTGITMQNQNGYGLNGIVSWGPNVWHNYGCFQSVYSSSGSRNNLGWFGGPGG